MRSLTGFEHYNHTEVKGIRLVYTRWLSGPPRGMKSISRIKFTINLRKPVCISKITSVLPHRQILSKSPLLMLSSSCYRLWFKPAIEAQEVFAGAILQPLGPRFAPVFMQACVLSSLLLSVNFVCLCQKCV